jgi:non-heme chloroperoxidase
MVKDAVLKVYPSAPYELAVTHRDELNADLIDFIKG